MNVTNGVKHKISHGFCWPWSHSQVWSDKIEKLAENKHDDSCHGYAFLGFDIPRIVSSGCLLHVHIILVQLYLLSVQVQHFTQGSNVVREHRSQQSHDYM